MTPGFGWAEEKSADDIVSFMERSRNWGRWGSRGQLGAANLITPSSRRAAAGLVSDGITVSLSRDVPTGPGGEGAQTAYAARTRSRVFGGGTATDQFTVACHGGEWTHLDALGHVWDESGMWEGGDPAQLFRSDGLVSGGVEVWGDGIVTRGVLLDVTRHRGSSHVSLDDPVSGDELADIAREEQVELRPGDALIIHSGRESWEASTGRTYGAIGGDPGGIMEQPDRPGLDVSCVPFIRESDCAVVVWDMMDALPSRHGLPWPVHSVLYLYGVALVDNASLSRLAGTCADLDRFEFLFIVAPLKLVGGTGSPVNPLACL